MKQLKIAYITYSGAVKYLPANGFNEAEDLLPYLQKKGVDIKAEIWDDTSVNWKDYDVALLKMPWDYHQKYPRFKNWLDDLQKSGLRLLNDFDIVRWNMDKHYLTDIANKGFEVIPTIFLDKEWNGKLLPLFTELQTDELILKPCVSGGSKNTIVLDKHSTTEKSVIVYSLLKEGDFMVQPLMHEVENGEWSFVFFNNVYSHTVIKKPKPGDFRVQQVYGGSITTVYPKQSDIDYAAAYLQSFADNAFYARVDGLMVNGKFLLMELELIEPFLYLSYGDGAVERYYNALQEQLSLLSL